ncbi:hypothetical protein [Streptomyces sp. NRRL B-24572]|uniref:hypothetical protein n=1 Tax=Streptomyces sp. NRRL B-24572 TaxID=1962156 RepID=UPI000A3B92FE|nr:hypothetical protein [Streptomyces sp. NRRL B-24572]
MDRLWDVLGDVLMLGFGPLMAWTAWEWWARPERAPAWVGRGGRWVALCWTAGFALLGIGTGVGGVYGLAGLPEPEVVGSCRAAGPVLYLLVFWRSSVHGSRRRGETRPTVSAATDGTTGGPGR